MNRGLQDDHNFIGHKEEKGVYFMHKEYAIRRFRDEVDNVFLKNYITQ